MKKRCSGGKVPYGRKCIDLETYEYLFMEDLVNFTNNVSGMDIKEMFIKEGVEEGIGEHLGEKFRYYHNNALSFYNHLSGDNSKRFIRAFNKWRRKNPSRG